MVKLQTSVATMAALAVSGATAQGNNPDLGLTSQTSNYTCTSTTIQTLLDGATDNTTHAVVDFAYLIDSDASLASFKQTVGVNAMQETTPNYNVCAVKVNVTTDAGASFNFGAMLPATWGGRIMGAAPQGNGIEWGTLSAGLSYGYATIASNGGHDVSDYDPSWVTPNGLIDYGYRAVHETTVVGKQLITAWYRNESSYNYFTGCSVGGRHALKQAQMYPEDWDGVQAGAPAWWATHQQLWNLKRLTYQAPADSAHTIPTSMFPIIADEVVRQCDPQDGITDQVIMDPIACRFDPMTLSCGNVNTNLTTEANCLTAAQLETLAHIYGDWVETNQTFVYPSLTLGSEAGWDASIGDGSDASIEPQYWYIRNLLGLTNFTYEDLTLETVQLAEQLDPGNATADDYDLTPFFARGGKLLHWHGLSDATVSPKASIYFHDRVLETVGAKGVNASESYLLFMVPGLEHCTGTPANMDAPWYVAGALQAGVFDVLPDNVVYNAVHDATLMLEVWTENITSTDTGGWMGVGGPSYMVATAFANNSDPVELTINRKICPYPQQARFIVGGVQGHEDDWECVKLY